MQSLKQTQPGARLAAALLVTVGIAMHAADAQDTSVSAPAIGPRFRIVGVHGHRPPTLTKWSGADGQPALTAATPYPRPPLAGFTPYIAITTSDSHTHGELE